MSQENDIIGQIFAALEENDCTRALQLIVVGEQEYAANSAFLKAKALLCLKVGEYKTALAILQTAKKIAPEDGEIYYYITQTYEALAQYSTRDDVIMINSDHKEAVAYTDDLNVYKNRAAMRQLMAEPEDPLVSIIFIAYNNLERLTKPAIRSLLQYTPDINYELILIDNGSSDGTLEYFQSIAHGKKKIYHITKNIGAWYGHSSVRNACCGRLTKGKYIVNLPNDVIVTSNWLKNMLKCVESDETIGIVVPLTDTCSNLQTVDLAYQDFADMQRKAAQFNISDPRKWEERMRIIPFMSLMRQEVITLCGHGDEGFIYNFADDDLSFQFRRSGYKLMVCGDVFVHHEGSSIVGKDPGKMQLDLDKGRQVFRQKYYGIDAWDDVGCYEEFVFSLLDFPARDTKYPVHILGVDTCCGIPLLEFKNKLKLSGCFQTKLFAFSQQAKYWQDLKSICDGEVVCDRSGYLGEYFSQEYFDYIFIGEPLDTYDSPDRLLEQLIGRLARNGRLSFKVKNYAHIINYVEGQPLRFDKEEFFRYKSRLKAVRQFVRENNCAIEQQGIEYFPLSAEQKQRLQSMVEAIAAAPEVNQLVKKFMTDQTVFVVQKNNERVV